MARDKKASFKFSTVADGTGTIAQAPVSGSGNLQTVATYSGSKAYTVASDVFQTWNEIVADAAAFGSQADTKTSTAAALVGNNGQNSPQFVKVIYQNNASVSGAGTPTLSIVGSTAATTSGNAGALSSSVPVTPATALDTTVSVTKVVYLPLLTPRPYIQLQITGTTSSGAGTVTILMAAIVNGRDGSVGL
jgi:hypothetical protein